LTGGSRDAPTRVVALAGGAGAKLAEGRAGRRRRSAAVIVNTADETGVTVSRVCDPTQ